MVYRTLWFALGSVEAPILENGCHVNE
jgi:hypothetical protein